ncbi:hypothetical protein lerEdw1_017415 [Lerista edwardsae]|nr:hypothetical protein lerEdw1_017415 [Lerista edwardsae]
MATSDPSSSNTAQDPNPTNLRPTTILLASEFVIHMTNIHMNLGDKEPQTYDTWCGVAHGCTKKIGLKICGK